MNTYLDDYAQNESWTIESLADLEANLAQAEEMYNTPDEAGLGTYYYLQDVILELKHKIKNFK